MLTATVKPPLGTPINWTIPHACGVVHYWNFAEAITGYPITFRDLAGRAALSPVTAPEAVTAFPSTYGPAIKCGLNGGQAQRLEHTRDIRLTNVPGFTIAFRALFPTGFTGAFLGIWGQNPAAFMVRTPGPNNMIWDVWDVSQNNYGEVDFDPVGMHDRWTSFAFVANGTHLIGYMDGYERARVSLAGPYLPPTVNTWRVGDSYNTAANGQFGLDYLAYYDRALTPQEIYDYYVYPFRVQARRSFAQLRFVGLPVPSGQRDWFILNGIADLIRGTGQFHNVSVTGVIDRVGQSAEHYRFATLDLIGFEETPWASEPEYDVMTQRTVTFSVNIAVRDQDNEQRVRELDRLCQVVQNAFSGKCILNSTEADLTYIRSGRYLPHVGPERQMVLTGQWVEMVDAHDLRDEDP